jgi:hypothetical protein
MVLFCAQATSANAAGPDRPECSISQITRLSDAGAGRPFISGRGTRIVFMSNALYSSGDLTGQNADGPPQVFLATCGVVNAYVSLIAAESTFQTSPDTAGCPPGVVGTFTFTADLTALPGSPALTNLQLQVQTLTNDNLLQNADFGPAHIAATLAVPMSGGYTDGLLTPGESVDVPFVICLQDRSPFQLLVDVLGDAR